MKKALSLGLATLMAISSMQATAFAIEGQWQSGWTGKEGGKGYSVTDNGDSVTLTNEKVNNGKFSDGEDSLVYYGAKASADSDFELTATVSIDEFSVDKESSNPNQSSVGLAVLDELFNKTDDKTYTNSVFVGSWAAKKTEEPAFYPIVRDNSAEKTQGEALSETFPLSGENLGEYKLSIKKTGTAYTLTCGENSTTVELSSMSDDIYPCLYIARNVKATFKDVSIKVDNRKAVALTLEGQPKTEYLYGQELDLKDVKAIVTYDDGSKEEVSDYLVKGYNPKTLGKQTVKLVRGAVSAEIPVTVSPIKATALNVAYAPLRTTYYKGMCFRTEGLQVEAAFNDGTARVLEADEYELKYKNKSLKDGDVLNNQGNTNVKVVLKDTKGLSGGGASDSFMLKVEKEELTAVEVTAPRKTLYYIGDEIDTKGMAVYGVYGDKRVLLKKGEYEISGFDTKTAGEKTLKITPKGAKVSADLKVTVAERQATSVEITKYPRTTYLVGEAFDPGDMVVSIVYDNGDKEATTAYTTTMVKDSLATGGESVVSVAVEGLKPVELKLNSVTNEKNVWQKAVFGQSSGYDKQADGQVGVKADSLAAAEGKVNVRSWGGAGKITNDHDGISYYYTTVEGDKNFDLSAKLTVNKYLEHDNDDTRRNGQEAFGIMLRDAVPLTGEDGKLTTDVKAAKKDESGQPMPLEGNSVFASNMMIVGGYSGTGWPNDPTALSYEKNTKINRINMLVREGVEAPDGGGKRVGPYAISSDFPKEGNSYELRVKKLNGGITATCKNLATGEVMENTYFDDRFLYTQNRDVAYVGFFTARWADIDVENIRLYETDKTYDQTLESDEVKLNTPNVEITSPKYVSDENYSITLNSEDSTGKVSVRLNDSLVAEDADITPEGITLPVKLRKNAENKITVSYTPSDTESLTSYEPIVLRQNVVCKSLNQSAKEIYVSPTADFKGEGTVESPIGLDSAVGLIAPGQTIVMTEGVYKRSTPIEIELGNDGTAEKPKTLKAQEGKRVVVDLTAQSQGVIHTGNYWHIKGIEFTNSGANLKCYHLGGSNNVIESCVFHDNRDLGLQISRTYGTDDRSKWPANNLVLNCESYNNCDPSMINADGFGAKLTVGEGNVFRGCKSHHNLDDGWDLYTKVNTGAIGAVTLEGCEAYKNGYRLLEDGSEEEYGKGGNNGFKLGGENVGVKHVLINCLAYDNLHNGLTTNSNPMLSLEGCKAYDNKAANIRLYSDKPQDYSYDVKNTLSYNGGEDDVLGTVTEDKDFTNRGTILGEDNYFYLGGKSVNSVGEELKN